MDAARAKLLRAIGSRHRYARLRRLTMALTLAALAVVPLARLARVDLAGDGGWALGRRVDRVTAVAAVAVAIGAFYLITFLVNAAMGRAFCGFGCPIGEASRLADAVDAAPPPTASPRRANAPRARRRAALRLAAWSLALSATIVPWWIAPLAHPLLAAVGWLALAVAVFAHGGLWRWSFCRRFCPIGLYYSAVQTRHRFGVHFDRARGCIDCDACATICPVALEPRRLDAPVSGIGGLALDEMPGAHHCLTCGDCVRACEMVLRKRNLPSLPLRLGR